MGAKLLCRTGEFAGNDFTVGRKASIGRRSNNEVVVPLPAISDRHASIEFDEASGFYYLENLDRKSRTRLDGVEVRKRTRLSDLHVVTLADQVDLVFCVVSETPGSATVRAKPQRISVPQLGTAPAESGSKTLMQKIKGFVLPASVSTAGRKPEASQPGTAKHQPARLQVPTFDQARQQPHEPPPELQGDQSDAPVEDILLVLYLPDGQETIRLHPGEHVVGRSQECAVCLDDPSLSRRHARIRVEQGRVWIQDLGSVNHTYLEDSKLTGESEASAGDSIRFGRIRAEWKAPEG